ncbi:MAG: uncharacterized protein KVP18_002483 [Porospora cf. gigantea A]|uniref:uncharacterized protein n=1 Tax=Porospora cf. gigantea A TaxID=2853593 RepID=UPI003559686F|nr:MAG: hypothetical protein KVP18_002483 [Porospora cf. gigantea A]
MKLLKEAGSTRVASLAPLVASRSSGNTSQDWFDFGRSGSTEEEPLCNFTATAYYREPSPPVFNNFVPETVSTIVSPTTYRRIAFEEEDTAVNFVLQSPPTFRRQTVSVGYQARPPHASPQIRPIAMPSPARPIDPAHMAPSHIAPAHIAPAHIAPAPSYRWVKPSPRPPQV